MPSEILNIKDCLKDPTQKSLLNFLGIGINRPYNNLLSEIIH